MARPNFLNFSPVATSDDKKLFRLAIAMWLILLVVIGILVGRNPEQSTVNLYYHNASRDWLARLDMYAWGHLRMNYLPHFAILFAPLHLMPVPLGDLIWHLGSIVLFATGIRRFVKNIFGDAAPRLFVWITYFTIPLSAAAIRNGQSNTILAALMIHAAASIAAKRWWPAAGLFMLALIAKPIAIVLVLLAVVFYPRLILPFLMLTLPMAVFPYLFAKPDYVTAQYQSFWANICSCTVVDEYDYADITGILIPLHIRMSPMVSQMVRAAAALATLGAWLWGARKMEEPVRAFWLLTLAGVYLMLFNPMNESNSYIILAPALAVWSVFLLARGQAGPGWGIAAMVLTMGFFPNLFRPIFGNHMAMFYHPLMTIIFTTMMLVLIGREKTLPFGLRAAEGAARA